MLVGKLSGASRQHARAHQSITMASLCTNKKLSKQFPRHKLTTCWPIANIEVSVSTIHTSSSIECERKIYSKACLTYSFNSRPEGEQNRRGTPIEAWHLFPKTPIVSCLSAYCILRNLNANRCKSCSTWQIMRDNISPLRPSVCSNEVAEIKVYLQNESQTAARFSDWSLPKHARPFSSSLLWSENAKQR